MGLGVCFVDCGFFDLYVLTGVCWFGWVFGFRVLVLWLWCFGFWRCGFACDGFAILVCGFVGLPVLPICLWCL